jgi:competence protein ComEC
MSHDPSVDVTTGRGSRSEVTDSRAARMGHGAAQQRLWQVAGRVSTPVERLTHLLDAQLGRAGLERGPWVVVAVIAGVAAWFTLPTMVTWLAAAGLALALGLLGLLLLRKEQTPDLAIALLAIGLGIALGIALIWARSATVGAPAIEYPQVRAMQKVQRRSGCA